MTDTIPQEDHQYYCKQLANTLRFFLVNSDGVSRAYACEALGLLNDYTEFEAAGKPIPLKNSIRDAITAAAIDEADPLQAILTVIADRAEDAIRHVQDETDLVEDIANWLLYEAKQPEIGA